MDLDLFGESFYPQFSRDMFLSNLIYQWKIRKYTKSKLALPFDNAGKGLCISSPPFVEIEKKWTMPVSNWGLIMNQFMLIFENRIQI